MNLAEMPDPALVADQLSLTGLACVRNCGPTTVVRSPSRTHEAERSARSGRMKLCAPKIKPPLHADVPI